MSSIASAFNIHPSLRLILKMNFRGASKKFIRNILTPHGVVVIAISGAYVWAVFVFRDIFIKDFFPVLSNRGGFALFYLFLITLEAAFSAKVVYFSNAETYFFTAAPLLREDLLTYRFLQRLQVIVIFSAISALIFSPDNFLNVFFRVCPALIVLATAPPALTAILQRFPPALPIMLRKLLHWAVGGFVALALLGALFAMFWNGKTMVLGFLDSRELHFALFPFFWVNALLFGPGILNTLILAVLSGVFSVFCFTYSRRFLDLQNDLLVEAREESTEKVERYKRQGFALRRVEAVKINIPDLKRMDGIGPVLWRRIQELSRHFPYLVGLLILGLGYHAWIVSMLLKQNTVGGPSVSSQSVNLIYIGQIITVALAFLFAAFDFKADTHRLEWLKSLPLKSSRIATGQLAISTLLLMLVSGIELLINYKLLCQRFPDEHFSVSYFSYLVLLAPVCLLYAAAANALFLLIPNYGAERRSSTGLLQHLAAMALALVIPGGLYAVILGCSALSLRAGGGDFVLFGLLVVAFSTLAALAFRLVVWAFERFDISRVSR